MTDHESPEELNRRHLFQALAAGAAVFRRHRLPRARAATACRGANRCDSRGLCA
jgi:hypothetical protein